MQISTFILQMNIYSLSELIHLLEYHLIMKSEFILECLCLLDVHNKIFYYNYVDYNIVKKVKKYQDLFPFNKDNR